MEEATSDIDDILELSQGDDNVPKITTKSILQADKVSMTSFEKTSVSTDTEKSLGVNYECTRCNRKFSYYHSYTNPLNRRRCGENLECTVCHKVLKSEKAFKLHHKRKYAQPLH